MRILVITTLALALSAQEPLTIQAPIQRVRLHPDEAWITRIGKVQLPGPGTHRIRIKGLPLGIKVDDLRAWARGPAGLRMGDISLSPEEKEEREAETQKLQDELEALKTRRQALEIEHESQKEGKELEITYLKNIQAAQAKELSSRLPYAIPKASGLIELGRSLQARVAELSKAQRLREKELNKLWQEMEATTQQLNELNQERAPEWAEAVLELTSTRPGHAEIEVGYRCRNASWRPSYEARLSEDRKTLELSMFATVSQKSGEDWEGVRIEISNARPALNLTLATYTCGRNLAIFPGPDATPYRAMEDKVSVNYSAEQLIQIMPGLSGNGGGAVVRGNSANTIQYRIDGADVRDETAIQTTATLIDEARGLTKTFLVEGSKDVPADGGLRRFKVLAVPVEPQLVVFTTPRLNPSAFLLARFPAPEGLPIFPGSPVVRFAGNQRLGDAPISIPAAGQPFNLAFGPYKSVRTAIHKGAVKTELVGSFTKERQWTITEKMEVENDGGETLAMEVQDRILTSSTDQIKVNELPGFAEGSTVDIPGVRTWKFNLAPKSHKILELPIAIRGPKEGMVRGLEGMNLGQP